MTNQNAIETAILDRLTPLKDLGIDVRHLPNRPAEAGVVKEDGVVTVTTLAGQRSLGTGADRSIQPMLQSMIIAGRVKKMRSDNQGLLRIQPELNKLLINFRPPGAGAIRMHSFDFPARDKHFWIFEAEYRFPLLEIAAA